MALTLYLVRHGQSEWNVAGRLQGQTHHPRLTALGLRQAQAAAATLAAQGPVDRVLSSDLVRAVQTAAPIAGRLGVAVEIEPRLREQGMGRLEGLATAEAFEAAAGITWSESARLGGAASESMRDVAIRVGALIEELIADPGSVVLVSHGDTIRIALGALGAATVAHLDNGSITACRIEDGRLVEIAQVQSITS